MTNTRRPGTCSVLFLLIMAFGIAACNSAGSDWEKAQRINSIAAYQKFIEKHADAPMAGEARRLLDDLEWIEAKAKSTQEAYGAYIAKYAAGGHISEAKAALEDLDWAEAGTGKDGEPARRIELLKAFLAKYPNSAHVEEAREMLWDIEEPKVEISSAQLMLIWSKGEGSIYDSQTQYTGMYMTSNGIAFDKIGMFGDAIVFIWRDFSESELPKVQALGLRTGVAYLKTQSGFKVIRRVDLRKSDKQLRAEFGI